MLEIKLFTFTLLLLCIALPFMCVSINSVPQVILNHCTNTRFQGILVNQCKYFQNEITCFYEPCWWSFYLLRWVMRSSCVWKSQVFAILPILVELNWFGSLRNNIKQGAHLHVQKGAPVLTSDGSGLINIFYCFPLPSI